MKHVIVGGVAGGATAAARIRRLDEHAEIIWLWEIRFVAECIAHGCGSNGKYISHITHGCGSGEK